MHFHCKGLSSSLVGPTSEMLHVSSETRLKKTCQPQRLCGRNASKGSLTDWSTARRVIQSRHLSRPMENEDEGDTRSEVSNRQPKGDVIGDDLPPALIEVCNCNKFHVLY